MNDDIVTFMKQIWQSIPYRTAIGIAKDGYPIFSPYYSHGNFYLDCEVDVCNGMMTNGQYSYVSTFFHPYIMGCFGMGNN
jgi:hypothetical protein